MTRAKAHPTRMEDWFGDDSRALVRRLGYQHEKGRWQGIPAGKDFGRIFPTWREAMAYALGNDTKETKE